MAKEVIFLPLELTKSDRALIRAACQVEGRVMQRACADELRAFARRVFASQADAAAGSNNTGAAE